MFGKIEPLALIIFIDPQPNDGLRDFDDDVAGDGGPDNGHADGDQLTQKGGADGNALWQSHAAEAGIGEDAGQQNAEDAADPMDREHVQGIVDLQGLLDQVDGKEANDTGQQAIDQRAHRTNEAGAGRDCR